MQKFIIPQTDMLPATAEIRGQDAKHIFKVLRKQKGDLLPATDGRGKDYTARIISLSQHCIELEIVNSTVSTAESFLDLTLCSAMLKSDKMDFIIKHAAQLGIKRWQPFFCERSIPLPDNKKLKNRIMRWESIAKESLKQCQRSILPEISNPLGFDQLMGETDSCDIRITFYENSDQKLICLNPDQPVRSILIMIGPEGGFSKAEIEKARQKGFFNLSLGPRILRAETASIAACTLIQHRFGDM